jgi:hypothetical protein
LTDIYHHNLTLNKQLLERIIEQLLAANNGENYAFVINLLLGKHKVGFPMHFVPNSNLDCSQKAWSNFHREIGSDIQRAKMRRKHPQGNSPAFVDKSTNSLFNRRKPAVFDDLWKKPSNH